MAKKIEVQIVGDTRGLSRAFNDASSKTNKFGSSFAKLGSMAAVGLAGVGVGAALAGKKMIEMASDAAEVQSKMEVVFGKQLPGLTKQIDKFSAATGTSRFEMREQAADMGALLEPLVGTKKRAAEMSLQFTKLATDLGSFNNVPTADALLAIRSGLVGEAEPLRRFGVLLNEAAVKQEALRLGLVKGKEELTEQQKVQARASLIMQQTSLAQGDATRTAGSMANQMKALRTNVSDAATSLGVALLPTALKVVQWFNANWPTILRVSQQVFAGIGRAIDAVKPVFANLIAGIRSIVAFSQANWPKVQEAAARVVAWYKGTLEPAIKNVIAAVTAIWNRFGGDITKIAKAAFAMVSAVVKNGLAIIQGVVEGVLALIRGDWTQAWNSLKTVVSKTLSSIGAIIKGFASIAFTAATAIGAAVVDGVVSGMSGLFGRVKDKIVGGIKGAIGAAGSFLHGSGPFEFTRHTVGAPLAKGIVEGMDGGLALLQPKMQARIKAAVARAQSVVDAARARMQSSFSLLSDKLMRAFDAETGGHQTPAEKMLADINDRRQSEDLNRALAEAMLGGDADAIARAQEDIQVAALQKQAANERQFYEDQRGALRENLELRLQGLNASFEKEGTTVAKALAKINKIMQAYGITFAESGQLIGAQFVKGLIGAIAGAAGGAAGVRGAQTGGNARPDIPPIITQVVLDGEIVAQSAQKYLLRTQNRGASLGFQAA